MTGTPPLPTRLSLLRIVAQGLVPARGAADPLTAVRSMLAIQGQQVSAVPQAILARTPTATGSQVRRAFDELSLVRSWPMRGTVHITAADDHHWLRSALRHRYSAWMSTSTEAGIDERLLGRAAEIALAAIHERGPVSRAELLALWEEAGLRPERRVSYGSHPMSESFAKSWWRRHLIVRLHIEGVLVQGPVGVNEHLLVDASTLPADDEGALGPGVERGGPRHRDTLAEIARRYAMGHGPVSAHDLARWTTLPVGEAHRALEDAVESGAARGGNALTRIRVERSVRGGWSSERAALRRADRDVLYMREDLEDLLADSEREARGTHFLPSFDELHIGYLDRSCLADAAGEEAICPAKNGMLRPFVVDAGRLVAVRPAKEGLLYISESPSAALRGRSLRAINRMLGRLSA